MPRDHQHIAVGGFESSEEAHLAARIDTARFEQGDLRGIHRGGQPSLDECFADGRITWRFTEKIEHGALGANRCGPRQEMWIPMKRSTSNTQPSQTPAPPAMTRMGTLALTYETPATG